jgi:hypothetical protein
VFIDDRKEPTMNTIEFHGGDEDDKHGLITSDQMTMCDKRSTAVRTG